MKTEFSIYVRPFFEVRGLTRLRVSFMVEVREMKEQVFTIQC